MLPAATRRPVSITTDYSLKSKSYALFGNLDYKFTEKFDVAVGLRQTWETKDIDYLYRTAPNGTTYNNVAQWWLPGSLNANLTTAARQNDSKTWSAFTYDITPTYQFTDNLRAYFRHAKGSMAAASMPAPLRKVR